MTAPRGKINVDSFCLFVDWYFDGNDLSSVNVWVSLLRRWQSRERLRFCDLNERKRLMETSNRQANLELRFQRKSGLHLTERERLDGMSSSSKSSICHYQSLWTLLATLETSSWLGNGNTWKLRSVISGSIVSVYDRFGGWPLRRLIPVLGQVGPSAIKAKCGFSGSH